MCKQTWGRKITFCFREIFRFSASVMSENLILQISYLWDCQFTWFVDNLNILNGLNINGFRTSVLRFLGTEAGKVIHLSVVVVMNLQETVLPE